MKKSELNQIIKEEINRALNSVDKNNTFYRLEMIRQIKNGKIEKSNVEVAKTLSELAIITYSWYGMELDTFELFKIKGIIQGIEEHTYQLEKTEKIINFCNKNNIEWVKDMRDEEYIISFIKVPTVKILEMDIINKNILNKFYQQIVE